MHHPLPNESLLVAAGAFELPQLALLAGVLVLTLVMLAGARRRRRDADESPREYARRQVAQFREDAGLKSDMGELVAELHEASRRLSAQLDTKAARLEALLRDADARIARLEALAAGRPLPPAVDIVVDDGRAPAPAAPARAAGDQPPESTATAPPANPSAARTSRSVGAPANQPALAPSPRPTPEASSAGSGEQSSSPAAAPGQRRDEVYALADAGRNVVEIARTTGLKPGEIELLLALRAPVPDAGAKAPARRTKR